ncbi:MAG: CPBP family intramembrane metalloprotease [Phycisphaerales bacterium]|nr:CPBP family intramembrane metalloprotease [Phycisphaerales bacterium]MCB9864212.1 CPBP family intramembrane metalloprotease [Phycisphaerales bacterium]
MIALSLLIAIPCVMWLAQTAMLRRHHLPIRWRLSNRDAPRQVRTVGRIATQAGLVSVIVLYPLSIGAPILGHYAHLYPRDASVMDAVVGALMAIVILVGLFLVWLACGRLEIDVHHERRRWVRRLVLLIPSAAFGAIVEESVFRGVLQFDLVRSGVSPVPSIAIAGAVFAAAHYVRSVKRKWTIFGHLALGVALSAAFAATHNLWLATGIHAGGILVILGARPFIRYRGPAWLTGESIFPFAGVPGVFGLAMLTMIVIMRFWRP